MPYWGDISPRQWDIMMLTASVSVCVGIITGFIQQHWKNKISGYDAECLCVCVLCCMV